MNKNERLQLITDLVEAQQISTQGELVQALRKKGHDVTQSSVSRDIDELGIEKIDGRYAKGARPARSGLELKSVESAGEHLLVAKCGSGLASAITVLIDSRDFPFVAGTIAGDDTIFIAVRNKADQRAAIEAIRGMF